MLQILRKTTRLRRPRGSRCPPLLYHPRQLRQLHQALPQDLDLELYTTLALPTVRLCP
jgi:hypothetical protein